MSFEEPTPLSAPNAVVQLATGEKVPLASLYSHRPLALVFVRHLGCPFCREHVVQLRTLKGKNVAVVTRASAREAEAFAERLGSSHRYISDPDGVLFEHFGLGSASVADMISPRTIGRGLGALKYGASKPESDPFQLGGTFVLTTGGEVAWSHISRSPSDNAPVLEIDRQLTLASRR